jgi:hypothetical protein
MVSVSGVTPMLVLLQFWAETRARQQSVDRNASAGRAPRRRRDFMVGTSREKHELERFDRSVAAARKRLDLTSGRPPRSIVDAVSSRTA